MKSKLLFVYKDYIFGFINRFQSQKNADSI